MYDEVLNIMDEMGIRGFTGWEELIGRGTSDGEPHLGDHAWPSMNSALISVMEDAQATAFLARLRALDEENNEQGLKAFAWDVTGVM
jgi:hypothetical protein